MFLDKKDCDFFKIIKKHGNDSLYKLARPLFSVVTINNKLKELEAKGLITKELIGRTNEILLTVKGKETLDYINKLIYIVA